MKKKAVVRERHARLLNVPKEFFFDRSSQVTEEDTLGVDGDLVEICKAPMVPLPHSQVKP